ncbi:MAG: VOC family protein [Prevotella sp.]|jgi:predicted enzyme related to lactoylglutathione lyase|nr:VOC family protein [Prevotella sp.]MCH3991812.1 VOC family protein [Prevotella sp.]MCH4017627.1 VOC family protein [Prevotella sp.]MCH4185532.1 VOC family protein [Prevotella sp.]MCH4216622.1 VOC family protein [Prevotella sp.]
MKTDNYFLPADDFEEARKFYSQTLGLRVKFDFPEKGMTAYRIGKDEPAIIIKDKHKYPDARPAIWIEVEDVRKVCLEMKAKGVHFLSEPFRIPTGWAVEFDDPSGNRLGITDYQV